MDKRLYNVIDTIYPFKNKKISKYDVHKFTVQKHTTFRKKSKTVLLGFNKHYSKEHIIYNQVKYASNEKVEQLDVLSKQEKLFYIPFIIDDPQKIIKKTKNIWDIIRQLDKRFETVITIKDILNLLYDKNYIKKMLNMDFCYPKILFREEDKKSYRVHFDVRFPINGKLFSFVIAKEPPNENRRRLGVLQMPDHPADYQFFQGIVYQDYGYGQVELADIGSIHYNEILDNINHLRKIDVTLKGKYVLKGNYTLIKDNKKRIVWYLIYKKNQILR